MAVNVERVGDTVTATFPDGHVTTYTLKKCDRCGKEYPFYCNYCDDWECNIARLHEEGCEEYTPNGLPIRCVTASGLMLECEHGDHPDYVFPVDIEFIGDIDKGHYEDYKMCGGEQNLSEDEVRRCLGETHALIYTDGSVVLTMYECCYTMWYLSNNESGCVAGLSAGGFNEKRKWKLSDGSLEKIRNYVKNGKKR